MTDPLSHIRHLAQVIGPRPTGSEAERRAAAYAAGQLEGGGYVPATERFRTPASYSATYIAICLLGLVGLLAADWAPALGFLLSAIAVVALIGENTGTPLLLMTAIVPKRWSQNVIGRRLAAEFPRRKVVLVAHLDTARSGPMFSPSQAPFIRAGFLALLFSLAALPLLTMAATIRPAHGAALLLARIPALILVWTIAQLGWREVRGRHVPGASDNASGVGVVLTLAEELAREAFRDTELWMVFTGAEEAGLFGMRELLRRHGRELEDALLINVDNVGSGQLHYTTAEGMIPVLRCAPDLLDAAERVADEQHLAVTPVAFHRMLTDASLALSRGVPAMTVIALGPRGVPLNWHWRTDIVEAIDPDTIDLAYAFTRSVALRLAQPGLRLQQAASVSA
jgi:hypothetical protein